MPQGLVKNNPANDPDKKPVKARSHFKPNVSVYQTARFGECTPFYAAEVVPDDENFSIRVNSDVDTLTLKSPLMSPLKMRKDYFFAPLRAILPHNADLLETNPLTGDDVIPQDVNCVARPYDLYRVPQTVFERVRALATTSLEDLKTTFNIVDGETAGWERLFSNYLGWLFLFYRSSWYLLSEGSLLRNLGYNFHQIWHGPRYDDNMDFESFDQWFEKFFSAMTSLNSDFQVTMADGLVSRSSQSYGLDTQTYVVSFAPGLQHNLNPNVISFRKFLFLLQQGSVVVSLGNIRGLVPDADVMESLWLKFSDPWMADGSAGDHHHWTDVNIGVSRYSDSYYEQGQNDQKYFNLSRALAYQLACVQFYTNDSVDYIYSTKLWHENMLSLARVAHGNQISQFYYAYNGTLLPYDSCSGNVLRSVANVMYQYIPAWEIYANRNFDISSQIYLVLGLFYYGNILGFNRSLKFRDYFVGSKKAPMAVGDVNVPVQEGEFSVVDVTKNILRQRFLNQVNRVGRTLKEYSQGIFGATPMRDPTECVLLGSTSDVIGAEETQNTGSEQRNSMAITSHLRGESSKYAFEGSFSEFGVVVGILTFDVARPYVNSLDHALLHVDRFDMFNPFMQNIGDQAVEGCELNLNQNEQPFGYQLRYMEYRQRVDYAAGGFHHYLPGFCFLADSGNINAPGQTKLQIGPDFIRSRSYEFDELYQALPQLCPAGYFHFIIRHDVDVDINRPMLAAPSIL